MLKIFNCLGGVRSRFKLHRVNFFLLLSVLGLGLIVPGVVSAQVVDIPDPGLRAAIAAALNKAPGDAITRAEMETLVELRATSRDITDLRGIEFAINLTELSLWGNNVSDISLLSSLTNLTELSLSSNDISDISPLSSLINLTELSLSINDISDISPLSSLINLTVLWLSINDISDILPLSSLTNLTRLSLWGNNISDILPLSSLTNLTYLDIESNTISDISPLSSLTNLTVLWLNNNGISDISPLSSLTNLTVLYLHNNDISDISPLSSLTNLTVLYLRNNDISDISPLSSLTNLTILDLRNNNISDVETLEGLMAQGTVVYFSGNPAFETPGPKIEDGWVWLIVPATNVSSGSAAARSGRDFLSEASGGAVTEADVAVNGARPGTRVGDSVWTAARLDATDPDNLNAIAQDLDPDIASLIDAGVVPIHSETPQKIGDSVATDIDKRNALMPDDILETHINYPVAYGVVLIQSETLQPTRVYIGAGPVKVWLNGTLVHKNTGPRYVSDYETAVPVELMPGKNVLFIAAYRPYPWSSRWGAFFGFQDGTEYIVGAPGAGNLDVNGDGQVNVIDLAIVALFYGTQVPDGLSLPADVNADGIVNILDLTAVAQDIDAQGGTNGLSLIEAEAALVAAAELDGVAEAPAGFGNSSQHDLRRRITYHNVAEALADAEHLGHSVSATLKELLHLLTELSATPETTALLPNYPNPFNPETWIPYRLSKPAEVTITIHAINGQIVRKLALGHQAAGIYQNRSRAAYWDGRNQLGEPVASGLYFYTLTAGDFTATRKLLIAK